MNETNVAVPIIDIINDDTFQLTFSSDVVGVGGFNWELLYTWHNVPEKERQRNNYKSYLPIRYFIQMSIVQIILSLFIGY